MRMVSSYWLTRILDYERIRIVTACLRSEIEDCEAKRMVWSYRFTRTKDCENMHVVSSYRFGVALGRTCTQNPAWPRTEDMAPLEIAP